MKPEPSLRDSRIRNAYNDFLNREIQWLETEREAMHRELGQIRQSYAWRLVDRYRRWITRHRDQQVIRLYEKLAVWILDRSVGSGERDARKSYQDWVEAHELTSERIERLKPEAIAFPYRPLFGIVLRVNDTSEQSWLAAVIDSVCTQVYDNWHLSIVSNSADPSVDAVLSRYAATDPRISVRHDATGNGVTVTAPSFHGRMHGEFTTFLEPDGTLGINALYEVVKRLNRNPLDDLFYWDEDRLDSACRRSEPFFKPDWSPDLLLSMNYLGECLVIRTALAEKLGGLRHDFAPSQIYDLALRAVEHTDRIVHLPEVLFHRYEPSVESAHPTGEAAERDRQSTRAIEEALRRRGELGIVHTLGPGLYEVRYQIRGEPLVSIVIPTRDKLQLLRQCIESIEQSTDYKNYEIIVLDNDSSEPATMAYFKQIAGKAGVYHCPGGFNFSAISNLGASKAKGELLHFLNNDTQVVRPDWMRAMIEQAQRPQVGAVGAKLLFADGRIQHAGAVLGISGTIGHAFRLADGDTRHYFGLSDVIRDCSAVTAACMMMRRAVFDEVGGFDEKFMVDYADIDLCLRVRHRGYRIVYTPLALLHHYESSTRRRMHVSGDLEEFVKRWGHCLKKADPYYSRNLTQDREDWSIAP